MNINLNMFILIFTRIIFFISLCKALFPNGSPVALKTGFTLVFTYLLYMVINNNNMYEYHETTNIITSVINEAFVGYILAFITNSVFDMLTFAGGIIDTNMGLSMAAVYDNTTQSQSTVNGKLLYYGGLTLFVILNGHAILLRNLSESFILTPLGKSIVFQQSISDIINTIFNFFIIGVKISLPQVLIILLTDICMGLISRVVPQINVMIIGAPVKILVGLASLILILPTLLKAFLNIALNLNNIFEKILPTLTIMMKFPDDSSGEKTQEATPKRKKESRKKGQIPKSKDISLAITMIAMILVISNLGITIVNMLSEYILIHLTKLGEINSENIQYYKIFNEITITILKINLMFILPIMISGVVVNLAQTGFLITGESIKPSFNKINPISGFKNMFSKKNMLDLVKNIIIVGIVTCITYSYIQKNIPDIINIITLNIRGVGTKVKILLIGILNKIAILSVILGVIDYYIQYKLHKKELMMSIKEIKEEFKQDEGDPEIKAKIKQKQRELSQKKMMTSIPEATVIITNPTHYAIALKYTEGENKAPIVVAKGQNLIAQKIKEIAKNNNVPIIENKPLARMLYAKVDIGDEIPEEFYQAIVEILIMINNMEKKRR